MTGGGGITVVVPVWDGYVEFLGGCLASVLAQRGRDVRLLVVDNASRTPLPDLPPEVRALCLPERVSVGEARNRGLAEVETELVCFFDADDRMLPDMLVRLADALDTQADAVGAVCRFLSWDRRTGAVRPVRRMPRPVVFRVSRHQRLFALSNVFFNSFLVAGGLYRTAAVLDAGGFGDGNFGEDWLLAAGLTLRGRLLFLDAPGFLHRAEEGSLWHRPHRRAEVESLYRSLRERVAGDPRLPPWGRLALALARPVHRLEIRRRTVGGALVPRGAVET